MPEAAGLSGLPVSRILSALLARGGEHGELFFEEVRSLTVLMEDGRIERVVSGTDAGIGVRLLFRGKTYYAYANDRSAESLLALSSDLSRYAEGDGVAAALPAASREVPGPTVVRVPPAARGIGEKVALVREVDRIARGYSHEIRQVRVTSSESLRTIEVAAHPGVFAREEQTYCVLAVQAVAGDDGVAPTGNGRRESYRHKPSPRMTNTLILPGSTPPEAILSEADRGLLVVKMGGGQVNTVTGDFMFEVAEGYRIEGGKRGEPVRGSTITGNGPEVLSMIDRVGSDLGFGIGTCGKDGLGVPVGDAQPTLSIGPPFITVG